MIFRTCPRCQQKWLSKDEWRNDNREVGTEKRHAMCTHVRYEGRHKIETRHSDTITCALFEHKCGGRMVDEGKADCAIEQRELEVVREDEVA